MHSHQQAGEQVAAHPVGAAPFWLVRHAQPLIAPGLCYGALDVAADPQATRQAAQALAQQLPEQAHVTTSPLQRCELLMQEVYALRPDLICKTDARLTEMNFGCWEGQRWDGIAQSAFDAWTADFWQHRFGGAQSLAEFMAQVAQAWGDAQARSAAGVPQVWVTHAGVIRAVSLLTQGVFEVHDAALWPSDAPGFGQCRVVNGAPTRL